MTNSDLLPQLMRRELPESFRQLARSLNYIYFRQFYF